MTRPPILIFGPTASGKSDLALALAGRLGGAVINADSQQVYDGWRILSARPSAAEEARAPHLLYGHLPLGRPYSTGAWLTDAARALATCRERGLTPIVAGGTGLYLRALTQGLAPIPPVPPATRARGEAELQRLGLARFAALLAERDPATAATLDRANPRRVLRAWEVLEATGTPLAHWRARTGPPLVPPEAATLLVLEPPRPWLQDRIAARFEAMLSAGALQELRAVLARGLPWSHPAMKVLGARPLARHLAGDWPLDRAVEAAVAETRRYAKRQATWARNQMPGWPRITATEPAARVQEALALVDA